MAVDGWQRTFFLEPAALALRLQNKPVMRVWSEREHIAGFLDRRKWIAAKNFDEPATAEARQIQFDRLREAGKIYDDEDRLIVGLAQKGEHFRVVRVKKFKSAARKGTVLFAHPNHPTHPPKERRQILLLIFDVDRFVVVFRIDDNGQMQLLRVRF